MRNAKLAGAIFFFLIFVFGVFVGWTFAQQKPVNDERPIVEMRRDMKAFLKRSKSKDETQKSAAIYDLCLLHHEIVTDSRFDSNKSMVSLRAVVGNRLKKCKRDYELSVLRTKREQDKLNKRLGIEEGSSLLADETDLAPEYVLANSMAEYLHYTSELSGGPSEVFTYANGSFAPGDAQDLIRLIETTINPDTWRTNGGSGQMFFYKPACALVVSAGSLTQDRIYDLLRQMRDLSR